MLKINNLEKKYGNKVILEGLNLEIGAGTLYGFVGHNGAGKTTLIKCIMGIHDFSQGTILVDNISIKDEPERAKLKMAYVSDNPEYFNHFTGIQYLGFIADVYKMSKSERQERIKEYGDKLQLSADLSAPISSYSHGMKQKLALISALIHKPDILVMDEPFVGLDPVVSKIVKDIMRDICDQGGVVFFSTHILEVAEKICDELGVIRNGEIIASGKTADVLNGRSLEDLYLEIYKNE